jgi:NAD(P)-dependent dehydrogenase (short-subunit alcohol dehydrogenase family)
MSLLHNQVAIVTGAGRGIGAAIALQLQSEGAHVVATDLAFPHEQPGIIQYVSDVTSADAWQTLIDYVDQKFNRLDILVNNAGISGPVCPLTEYPDAAFARVMDINCTGVFYGIKYVSIAMQRYGNGGSIINIASNTGLTGSPAIIGYSASKHAVIGLTKSAAKGLAADNIRVNAVCPAPTATEMVFQLERMHTDPTLVRQRLTAGTPLGRYAEPNEIATAVCFLAGAGASFVTGAVLPVDGGSVA